MRSPSASLGKPSRLLAIALTLSQRAPRPHPNIQGSQAVHKADDDTDALFARAAHVFEHTFSTPREHQGFIEPPASLLWIDEQAGPGTR